MPLPCGDSELPLLVLRMLDAPLFNLGAFASILRSKFQFHADFLVLRTCEDGLATSCSPIHTTRKFSGLISLATMQYLWVIVTLSNAVSLAVAGGSCKTAGLCCSGRDSACVVQTAPINAIIEDINDDPCYCDHACLKLGDCCPDFREACGVKDCEVSEWGSWSDCDAECGPGQLKRSREVTHEPQHGGKHCPSLSQYRGCQGTKCNKHVQKAALRETALLLPEIYSALRKINETHDIRNNLKLRYPKSQTHHEEYCVEFEMTKVSRACHKEKYYDTMKTGDRVCIRCENAAARRHLDWHCGGHGVVDRSTRFTALNNPDCHGKWVRKTNHASSVCSCPENSAAFVFV